MRARLLGFVHALRDAGLACSVSETLDATRAAATAGIERPVLREALAATLVKDHAERPTFDVVFDRYFGGPPRASTKRTRRAAAGGEGGAGEEGEGRGPRPATQGAGARDAQREREERAQQFRSDAERLAARRTLLSKPFEAMDARDVEALKDLTAALARRFRARWSRRMRRARLGRVDLRRTIRRATTRGGVPLELRRRRPRPGKTDLVALVDLSFSTATAARFLLALLAPARRFFRRVLLVGYVDAISELSVERGHVIPHEPLDLNARSDFGRALVQLTARQPRQVRRNTLLLILGDARNNRRPPRADVLVALAREARAVVWLNPERRERWNTGDSVMSTYARHCTTVLNAWSPKTLIAALDAAWRAGRR